MKKLRFFGVALAATVLGIGFCACSDDDNKGVSGDNNGELLTYPTDDISIITTPAGDQVLLTSVDCTTFDYDEVDCTTFDYDEKGRCIRVNDRITISYDPYTIDWYDPAYLWFYASGYLGRGVLLGWDDEGGWETADFSYDSGGHLTKVSQDTGYAGSLYSNVTATFTWSGGDLVKIEYEGHEGFDPEDETVIGVITFEYGNVANECLQQTKVFSRFYGAASNSELGIWMDDYENFGYIGYLGKGPAHLPTHVDGVEEEYRCGIIERRSSETFDLSYTKNSDGTIATETQKVTRVGFYYEEDNGIREHTYEYSYISLAEAGTRSTVATLSTNTFAQREIAGKRSSHRSRMHGYLDTEN